MFKKLKRKGMSDLCQSLPNKDGGLNDHTQYDSTDKAGNDKTKFSVYADRGLMKKITDKLNMTRAEGDCIFDFIYCDQDDPLYAIMIFEQDKDFYVIAGWSRKDQFCQVDFVIPGDEICGFEEIWSEISWEEEYGRKSLAALLSGCNWGLRVRYKDINIHSEGYDAYPKDFKSTVRSLYLFAEKLRITYDRDSIGSIHFTADKNIQGPFMLTVSSPFCISCGRRLKMDQDICECGKSRFNDGADPRIIEPIRKREDIFYFSYGTIHGEQVEYRIIKRPDAFQVVLDSRSSHVSFMIPEKEICLLEAVWKDLSWGEEYIVYTSSTPGGIDGMIGQFGVIDGIVWKLEIAYHDFQMNSYGRFDTPADFDSFRVKLEKRLKKLQHKYGNGKNMFEFDRDKFGRIILT